MTKPSLVQTSIVVESIDARQSQWVFRKVDQLVWRFLSGAGSIPCAFRMLPMLLEEIRYLRFFRAPSIRS